MSNNNRSNDGGGIGFAVLVFFTVAAMPLLGLYLLAAGEEDGQKTLGLALLIVGIIVWIKFGLVGA